MQMPKIEDWMITSAYGIAEMLPTDHKEALTVLAIVRGMVEKINKRHLPRRRRRKAAK
jgi:hypothetical protein